MKPVISTVCDTCTPAPFWYLTAKFAVASTSTFEPAASTRTAERNSSTLPLPGAATRVFGVARSAFRSTFAITTSANFRSAPPCPKLAAMNLPLTFCAPMRFLLPMFVLSGCGRFDHHRDLPQFVQLPQQSRVEARRARFGRRRLHCLTRFHGDAVEHGQARGDEESGRRLELRQRAISHRASSCLRNRAGEEVPEFGRHQLGVEGHLDLDDVAGNDLPAVP